MVKRTFALLFTIFLLFSCKEEPVVKPRPPMLALSKSSINFSSFATKDTIFVHADQAWRIDNDAPWLIVEPKFNEGGGGLFVVHTSQNTSKEPRMATITIKSKESRREIKVSQEGEQYIIPQWRMFPVVDIQNTAVEESADGYTFTFKALESFVHKGIRQHIFPGSLMASDRSEVNKIETFNQYLKDKIKIMILLHPELEIITVRPSAQIMEDFVDDFLSTHEIHQISSAFFTDTPYSYTHRRELYLLGMSNLGLELDRLLFQSSYLDEDMKADEQGYIFTYSIKAFGVMTDTPSEIELTKEAEGKDFLSRLCHVNLVFYGRTGFLCTETKIPKDELKMLIRKLNQKQALTEEENKALGTITFRYLSFDKQGTPVVQTGGADVVQKYFEDMTDGPNIPISYTAFSYPSGASQRINYKVFVSNKK